MNIHLYITPIQFRIEYVDNTVNTEPGRTIKPYSGEIYNHIGKKWVHNHNIHRNIYWKSIEL